MNHKEYLSIYPLFSSTAGGSFNLIFLSLHLRYLLLWKIIQILEGLLKSRNDAELIMWAILTWKEPKKWEEGFSSILAIKNKPAGEGFWLNLIQHDLNKNATGDIIINEAQTRMPCHAKWIQDTLTTTLKSRSCFQEWCIGTLSRASFIQMWKDPPHTRHPYNESIKTGFVTIPFVKREFYGSMVLVI